MTGWLSFPLHRGKQVMHLSGEHKKVQIEMEPEIESSKMQV